MMTAACRVWHAAGASEDRAAPLQRWCPDQEPRCRSPVRRLAWWIDRPSASAPGPNGVRPLASSLVPWTGGGSEGSDPVRKRALPRRTVEAREPGRGEVEPPIPRAAWWKGLSKRRAAVGDDRAGRSSCPARIGQRPTGASLDALLLPHARPRAKVRREAIGAAAVPVGPFRKA
jgi:hypothetical protein